MRHMLGRLLCAFGIHGESVQKIYSFHAYWFCSRCGKIRQSHPRREEGMF
jgi:hypothetical protein